MSAIVGLYNLDKELAQRANVEHMVDILAHRGPDGATIWCEGPVGLGHRMLYATPESLHETLPLHDKARDIVLTADARLDNRDELMKELGLSSASHGVLSDSQLILAAYAKWGRNCPRHLLGDFAFVIWDAKHNQLFCARDHFGVKPFYYCYLPGQLFAFATEIKALFTLSEVPRRINETRLGEYFVGAFRSHESTFYRDIKRLTCSHTLEVSDSGLQLERYYDVRQTPMLTGLTDAEYERRFREIFFEAVRCRLRTPYGPQSVGSFLSGGLDSPSVACTVREIRRQEAHSTNQPVEPLATFSIVFEEAKESDEREYIETVTRDGDVTPHWIVGDNYGPLTDIEKVLWHTDEPFSAPNLCPSWVKYGVAHNHGIRVALDGHGGDETIGYGTAHLHELALAGSWKELRRELIALQNTGLLQNAQQHFRQARSHHHPTTKRLARLGHMARKLLKKRQIDSTPTPENSLLWHELMQPEFAQRVGANAIYDSQQRGIPRAQQGDRIYNEWSITGALQPLAFETLDKVAAAFQMEARYPMWDKRVVEFCLSLPAGQKLRDGYTRSILRRALHDVLPDAIRNRVDKTDFTASTTRGLAGRDWPWLKLLLDKQLPASSAYLDVANLTRIVNQTISNDNPSATFHGLSHIVLAVNVEIWLQQQRQTERAANIALATA